ncbi:MAG: LamG-like jellyroll fold domain-containing protein [Planctomycetota bacterium]
MKRHDFPWKKEQLAALAGLILLLNSCASPRLYVSPTGSDDAAGSENAPFRSIHRAQTAARDMAKDMQGDVVVQLAPGEYRLDRTLEFTEADSGRNGFRVIYRSAAGPGKARLLGSMPLVGWQPHRDCIWKIGVPEKMVFHTLYENGRRAHKARFPNYEHHPDMPTARGRYLVTEAGTPKPTGPGWDKIQPEGPGWLIYPPEDAPPVTTVTKMKILIYLGGKCDWMRSIYPVMSIEPKERRLTFKAQKVFTGVDTGARFFLEDELGFLDAPGEFFLDETAHTLYYMPMGKGHPDALGVAAPVLNRLVQMQGKSRNECVENLCLEGLALEETDDSPPTGWWGTQYGKKDGALIWMSNTNRVEIRDCHLKNSGRSGIMMIGQNTHNLVAGCWIEHTGVNGVTLCNRFSAPDKKAPTEDRCEHNRVHNCRVHNIGEIHTYAACVNIFNASHNEISHCELHDSVRYAVTLRGHTGEQYGPPVWVNLPGAKGNRMHHLRIYRCGQDGGDMGSLHAANLNNPGGGFVNTFEQITAADSRAIPSMKDIPPDGIFLDWPKMAMDQIFRNVHIIRSQGRQLRSNGPDNEASAQTVNVSWESGFCEELMDYETIGLTAEFPAEYGGRPPVPTPLPAPGNLKAKATAHDAVLLEWQPPKHDPAEKPIYTIFRNGEKIASTSDLRFADQFLKEHTVYRYRVAAQSGDFRKLGAPSAEREVRTPPDTVPPVLTGARAMPDGKRIRAAFSEPVDPTTAFAPGNYRFDPPVKVVTATALSPESVELVMEGFRPDVPCKLTVSNVTDATPARNVISKDNCVVVGDFTVIASYPVTGPETDRLRDASGGGGDARLHGNAVIERGAGPFGGAALVLDGKTGFAEAPEDLNLGVGDFTMMAWIYREAHGVILSKGNGFGSPNQWSWGWGKEGVPRSISLRVNNQFYATGAGSVADREWVHLAFVKQGNTGLTYVNGRPSGGPHDLSGVGPFVNDRRLRIGRREHEPDPAFFKGKIAGVILLNHALPPDQIRAYAQGK